MPNQITVETFIDSIFICIQIFEMKTKKKSKKKMKDIQFKPANAYENSSALLS